MSGEVRWNKWISRLENLFIGLNIKDTKRQRALLLHYAGEDVNEIFDTLQDTGEDFEHAKTKLNEYFAPKKNTEYEIYKFRQAKQTPNESIDSFNTRLRRLATNCEFTNIEKEIKSQIIQGCASTRLRRKALREDMNLEALISSARALEISEQQAAEIEKTESESVHAMKKTRNRPRYLKERLTIKGKDRRKNTKCRNCGGNYPHPERCPAFGKTCNFCKKPNHFSKVCRSKQQGTNKGFKPSKRVNRVENEEDSGTSDSDNDYIFGLHEEINSVKVERPKMKVKINDSVIDVLIDTGSSINVIDESAFESIKCKPKLEKANSKVFAYGSDTSLKLIGKFEAVIESRNKIATAPMYVVKGRHGNLLSYSTSVDLCIVPTISSISKSAEKLCEIYSDVFKGIGKMKGVQVKIHVDERVKSVSQPHRRIPFHIRRQVESELDRLEKLDIIEKVDGPTPWVSPIVVAPKPKSPNEIRLCVDMREPNKAILRERHITPTLEDMIFDLNGATVFSKCDLKNGYHQLELDEQSRNITTFTTHVGLRRYKRLSFGISSAAEIFQNTLSNALNGLEGVRNISDDIIVFGQTQQEHDKRLEKLFIRLIAKNLTLNKSKCEFNKDKLEFYGHIFSRKGISPDPRKVEAIKNCPIPNNVSEVRSFLAMTNYVGRFIRNYSTITEPLRRLTKKDCKWNWSAEQQKSFESLKQELIADTVIAYFNPKKETELIVDASPVGLGAILTQENKIITYASRALTDVETRYSQTEREGLAIVWAIEHFHLYLYGHRFTLISDHQPLETLFNNPKSKTPARIERWRLRLQNYNFRVKYKPGKSNAADYLSRHPTMNASKYKHSELAEEYVRYLSENAVPKAMTIQEIAESTRKDSDIQEVIESIKLNCWKSKYESNDLDTYFRIRYELSVVEIDEGEVLLHDTRIVIPKDLRARVVDLAHEGHQGIVRTKQLLREKVYFPGIDKYVENICKSCVPCLAATPKSDVEPLQMSILPDDVWENLSMDFCGPFPNGQYIMVILDEYSRYPIVETLTSLTAKTVIPLLDKVFSIFGIPKVLKTDNGPPFNSNDFRLFSNEMGFKHRKITPLWPKANGESERFMRTIGKAIRAANVEKTSWKQAMYSFLRNYRATPHRTTGLSPAELLFGRKIKTKLPFYGDNRPKGKVIKTDRQNKMKMKEYADKRGNAKKLEFEIGDQVLVKQEKKDKLSTPYNPSPMKIISKKGSMITAENDSATVTRNSSFFKKVGQRLKDYEEDEILDSKTIPDGSESNEIRRSMRAKKTPTYLKDYVQY